VHVPLFVAAHTYTPTYMLLSIEIASPSGLIPLPSDPSPVGFGPRRAMIQSTTCATHACMLLISPCMPPGFLLPIDLLSE